MMEAAITFIKRVYGLEKVTKFFLWCIFLIFTYAVLLIKYNNITHNNDALFFTIYSLTVSSFLLSRFLIAHFYVTDHRVDKSYQPTLSFSIPVKNEEKEIYNVIMRIAKSDYPKDKFEIMVVDDGSTDRSLSEMKRAKKEAEKIGVRTKIIEFMKNQGKRYGMAACVEASKNDVMVFIDSDSLVEPDTAKELVKFLKNPKVGAVTAHTYVENEDVNILTKMQSIKYFVSFKAYKGAEAIFGTVTCCSGPCSAYKREYLLEVLDQWLHQQFLGVECTYGDDRSLTNYLLEKGHKTLYAPEAKVSTFVPENLDQYKKQQIRWKKSWVRECIRISRYMWRRNPFMSVSFYLTIILTMIAPIIIVRAFIVYPVFAGKIPYFYLIGVFFMSVIYGTYYAIYTGDRKWMTPVLTLIGYSVVYFWQLPYAIATLKDAKWGTR